LLRRDAFKNPIHDSIAALAEKLECARRGGANALEQLPADRRTRAE
jgi:hypothetical protein